MKQRLLIILAVLTFALPVVAQDVTPTPQQPTTDAPPVVVVDAPAEPGEPTVEPPESTPIIPIEEAARMILTALFGAAAITAPITVTLTAIAKRLDKSSQLSANTWAIVIGTGVTIITWAARHFGVEAQVDSFYSFIVTSAPALLTLLATLGIGSGYYQLAVKAKTPGISYQRAPVAAQAAQTARDIEFTRPPTP